MAPAMEGLTDQQKEIYEKITKNEVDELKTLLSTCETKLDFVDKNGMSLLQHACYKGNKEIAQMLLDQGVDVNSCQHEHEYTALHFAALSGNSDLCHLLLSHGARISSTNSVGRTAAQMAAFVGNHNCVSTINNFIPKADIDYYIKPQGLQTEPLLPPHLADSFHKFIMQINVHPVRVAMNLQRCPGLLENLEKIQKVLEVMRHREMTRGAETNEVIAFKYHYLSFVVAEVIKCQNRQKAMKAQSDKCNEDGGGGGGSAEEKKSDPVEALVRRFLKCNKTDGIPEYQEAFLREAVREFPFRESTIFHQMVATLAGSDPPTAASVVSAAINGQRGFIDNSQICVTCGEEKVTKKCSKCKAVQYCDRECQRLHWFMHKKACARLETTTTTTTNSGTKLSQENKEQIANAKRGEEESEMEKLNNSPLILLVFILLICGDNEVLCRPPRGPIEEAIQSGAAANYSEDKCTWRRGNDKDSCPDPDVHLYLYSEIGKPKEKLEESRKSDWLRGGYDAAKENIILIHGYAGTEDSVPMMILREAYLRNGSYNVFSIDWGSLCAPPCYPAAVANLRPVARCLAGSLTTLRNLGLPISRTTCVGHSLGAHLCGIMANYLLFRMNRIIGLDPARPLIRSSLTNRLDSGDADFVQVIHTNAGYYGDKGRMGHVDFCVNGGKVQPFCENQTNFQLCSHVWVVCFMAQSVDNGGREMLAEPCSRRCPSGPRISQRAGEYLIMGQHTPTGSKGSFCLQSSNPPYCPKYANGHGDQKCCV